MYRDCQRYVKSLITIDCSDAILSGYFRRDKGRMVSDATGPSMELQKALRTAQHYLPGGRDRREAITRLWRRLGRKPHEPDFGALRFFPPGQLLLDVGANYGQSAASMRLVQPEAKIICYEPNIE